MLPDEFSITIPEEIGIGDIKPLIEETHECLHVLVDAHEIHLFFKLKEPERNGIDNLDKYYCEKCKRNHYNDSKIGIEHMVIK